jgi:hypothetical protein
LYSPRKLGVVLSAAVAAALAIFTAAAVAASTDPTFKDGQAEFTTIGGVDPQFLSGARTIDHWTFNYTDPTNGTTYPITMVGSDPRLGGSTTIKTEIIPLDIHFVAGNQKVAQLNDYGGAVPGFRAVAQDHWFRGSSKVADVEASPIFGNYTYPADLGGDAGQLGDVFMRAQFNKIGSSYHVRLATPDVLPTQTIEVPQEQGLAYVRPAGALAGIADAHWFSSRLQNLLNSLHIDPTTLPIFLTDNVLLYDGNNYLNCCILGYHGAGIPNGKGYGSPNGKGNNPVQTFAYAAWTEPNTYGGFNGGNALPTRGLGDIHGLSHEISEWLDDPFVNNAVQPWITPTAPQYGCTPVLETGDPVVGVWFPLAGNPEPGFAGLWHPEDEVFANWFARNGTAPLGLNPWSRYYTFMGARTIAIGGAYAGWGNLPATC